MPEDLHDLRAAHQALFPIDYESHFYDCVIHNKDDIFSWAAVCRSLPASLLRHHTVRYAEYIQHCLHCYRDAALQSELLVGFVTARTFRLYDCSITDRACMGLESR